MTLVQYLLKSSAAETETESHKSSCFPLNVQNVHYFFSIIVNTGYRSVVVVIESRFIFENWNYFRNFTNARENTWGFAYLLAKENWYYSLYFFKTLRDTLLGPVLWFKFNVWIMSLISPGVVWDELKLFGFRILR